MPECQSDVCFLKYVKSKVQPEHLAPLGAVVVIKDEALVLCNGLSGSRHAKPILQRIRTSSHKSRRPCWFLHGVVGQDEGF